MRHGMTIGELARLFNDHFGIGADLEVVTMEGWRRDMYHDDAQAPWVMPSPNMPTLDTAIVYPGTVLFEGTNVSEGRGTTRPFELLGAPWIADERFADALNARNLPGVFFRPAVFEPTFHKHAKSTCGGCQIHVTDRASVPAGPDRRAADRGVPRGGSAARSSGASRPYEYEYEKLPFDILAGTADTREQIEAGVPAEEIARSWDGECASSS